jgi:SAM-dependent MidA family methyltransferase
MEEALRRHGFPGALEFAGILLRPPRRHRHRPDRRGGGASPERERKLALAKLLHPSAMGQKFQVLHAQRGLDQAKNRRLRLA